MAQYINREGTFGVQEHLVTGHYHAPQSPHFVSPNRTYGAFPGCTLYGSNGHDHITVDSTEDGI